MATGMPRALRVMYLGVAGMAVAAFLIGLYEFTIAADESASLVRGVLLPGAIFLIVILLYRRRKRDMEAKAQAGRGS